MSVEQKYSTSEPGGVKDPRGPRGGSRSDHVEAQWGLFPVTRTIRVSPVRVVLNRAPESDGLSRLGVLGSRDVGPTRLYEQPDSPRTGGEP